MLGWNQVVEVSRDDARNSLLTALDEVGFAATSWQEGSIPLATVEIGAWIWSEATKIAVFLKLSQSNETAEGEALNRLSQSHYQNTRQEAKPELQLITLECDADEGPHTIELGKFTVKNNNGYLFTNVADEISATPTYPTSYPLNLPSGGSVQILVEAQQPGEDAITAAGTLTSIVTTLTGVTVTANEQKKVGVNEESDKKLSLRNSLKWAKLVTAGPIDETLAALALDVEAVDRVIVNSKNPRGAGTVDVYVTGATGEVGPSDIQAVIDLIQPRLMHDPLSDALFVDNAVTQALNITGTIYVATGYDWDTVVLPAIEAALEAWRRTIPLGGFAYPSPGNLVSVNDIEHQIRQVKVGEASVIKGVQLTTPSSNFGVTSNAHVTKGAWTFTPVIVTED